MRRRANPGPTRTIALVGLMGVGKSSVGRRLANRLRLPFADGDVEIEAAAGMTVSEIFGAPHTAAARKYHLEVGEQVDDEYMISRHPSVSIISNVGKDGKSAIFFGLSGTGKSTLAGWFADAGARVLSDERMILRRDAGSVRMFGTPWIGSGSFAANASEFSANSN